MEIHIMMHWGSQMQRVGIQVGFLLIAGILSGTLACGYKVRSSVGTLPSEAKSLGIPTFRNLTTQYKIEQLISRAVLQEFSTRTRSIVNSNASGVDMVLLGEIRNVSSGPVTFGTRTEDSQTTGSSFIVTVQLGVKLVRLSDSSLIWQNESFLFRERYSISNDVREFFSEENPALARLAQDFAASLASAVLNRSTP
jgi:hypothetical protein